MGNNNSALLTLNSELDQWWPSRYGAGDQLGALNEITPAKTAAAAQLVRRGITYDLGRILHADVPRFEGRYWQQSLVSAAERVYAFMFVLTHHKTRGSTASGIAPAAII